MSQKIVYALVAGPDTHQVVIGQQSFPDVETLENYTKICQWADNMVQRWQDTWRARGLTLNLNKYFKPGNWETAPRSLGEMAKWPAPGGYVVFANDGENEFTLALEDLVD